MKTKLYSKTHADTALKLFPEKGPEWYDEQWTDSEINLCKASELRSFIEKPSLGSYP
jgi:hypothetical protein